MKTASTYREVSPEGSLNKRQKTCEICESDSSSSTSDEPKAPRQDDVLTLDVGGEAIVKTLRSTLTSVPGSALAERFSGRRDDALANGHFFIDFKPDIFLPLLDYLRSINSMTSPPSCSQTLPFTPFFGDAKDETALRFRIMVDSYQLTHVLYNYEIYQLKPDRPFFGADRATLVSKEKSVTKFVMYSERGVAFVLDRPAVCTSGDCHSRRIQAFEVTFIKDQGIKIGWTRRDLYRTQPINGMGKSISIDSRLALPGMHHFHDHAVIRCSKDIHTGVLSWHVDGKELVSTSHNLKDGANKIDDVVYVASGIASDSELIPLVVPARGSSCRFSLIELEP